MAECLPDLHQSHLTRLAIRLRGRVGPCARVCRCRPPLVSCQRSLPLWRRPAATPFRLHPPSGGWSGGPVSDLRLSASPRPQLGGSDRPWRRRVRRTIVGVWGHADGPTTPPLDPFLPEHRPRRTGVYDADEHNWGVRGNAHRLMRLVAPARLHQDLLAAHHRPKVKPSGVCRREMRRVNPAPPIPVQPDVASRQVWVVRGLDIALPAYDNGPAAKRYRPTAPRVVWYQPPPWRTSQRRPGQGGDGRCYRRFRGPGHLLVTPPLVPVAPTSTGVGRHPRPLGVGAGSRRRILGSPLALPAAARSGVLSERRGGKQ